MEKLYYGTWRPDSETRIHGRENPEKCTTHIVYERCREHRPAKSGESFGSKSFPKFIPPSTSLFRWQRLFKHSNNERMKFDKRQKNSFVSLVIIILLWLSVY